MHVAEIAWLGIDELQTEIRRGTLSSVDVADAFLARIEELDPSLQAYSAVWPERARATAAGLDAAQKTGEPLGVLHGVAVALKDLCDVAGEPTRAGTTALGNRPAQENAEVVDRLEAAGAIILGKVKMTEGAFVSHHETVVPPVNPWNADRWTGISSSGSGVSVAGGLCTVALGTDTGGSIRYPSAACGLTGLKPTHGRVSLRGVYPLADSLDHIGPMTRSASDTARVFSVLCGYDPRDPWSLAHNPRVATSSALQPSMRGAKIGFDASYCETGVDPLISQALRNVLDTLHELGAEIVEFDLPPIADALAAWGSLAASEIATSHAETYAKKKAEYGVELATSIEAGQKATGQDVAHAWKMRLAFSRRLEGCFQAGAASRPGRGCLRQGFAALVAGAGDPRQLAQAAGAEVEPAAARGPAKQAAGWIQAGL